jgi:hypothetical protein
LLHTNPVGRPDAHSRTSHHRTSAIARRPG